MGEVLQKVMTRMFFLSLKSLRNVLRFHDEPAPPPPFVRDKILYFNRSLMIPNHIQYLLFPFRPSFETRLQ